MRRKTRLDLQHHVVEVEQGLEEADGDLAPKAVDARRECDVFAGHVGGVVAELVEAELLTDANGCA